MTQKLKLHFVPTNKQYEIVPGRAIIAGRAESCDLPLGQFFGVPVNIISSKHFKIYHETGRGFFLQDLYSTNGTQVNDGPMLAPETSLFLRHNDHIRLARRPEFEMVVLIEQGETGTDTMDEQAIQAAGLKLQSGLFLDLSEIEQRVQETRIGLYFDDNQFFLNGQLIPETMLTEIEQILLIYLYRHAGRVCTYSELSEKVWGFAEKASIAQAVKKLREKLDTLAPDAGQNHILTKRGFGYMCLPRLTTWVRA